MDAIAKYSSLAGKKKHEGRMMCYWLLHIIFSGPCRRNVASKICAWSEHDGCDPKKIICLQFQLNWQLDPIDLHGQMKMEVGSKKSTGFRLRHV